MAPFTQDPLIRAVVAALRLVGMARSMDLAVDEDIRLNILTRVTGVVTMVHRICLVLEIDLRAPAVPAYPLGLVRVTDRQLRSGRRIILTTPPRAPILSRNDSHVTFLIFRQSYLGGNSCLRTWKRAFLRGWRSCSKTRGDWSKSWRKDWRRREVGSEIGIDWREKVLGMVSGVSWRNSKFE